VSVENGHECGENAAAYVLGALEPDEAEAFRRHISECAECRDEVAAFEGLTDALPGADGPYEVPRGLRRRVMREVRATPKTAPAARAYKVRAPTRFPLAWGGALAAVVVAVIVAVALNTGGSGATRVIQANVGNAELRIANGHADLVIQRLPRLPTGRTYEMWVQRGSAAPTPTGTLFSTTSRGTASVGVPGSLDGVSRVMVTNEPTGGTLAPTGAPLIVAPVT
jgi:anti-sigma-K factor RskA